MPQEVPSDSRSSSPSTIGEDLTIEGNVSSTGELHINGRIKGDVSCAAAILGETSAIEGNVAAEEVMICGRLVGSIRGRRVMLQSTAHVEGDILHQDLAMEQGAYFDGRSRRSKDALSATDLTPELAVEKPKEEHGDGRKSTSNFVRTLQQSDSS